jgi:hypothetical protein
MPELDRCGPWRQASLLAVEPRHPARRKKRRTELEDSSVTVRASTVPGSKDAPFYVSQGWLRRSKLRFALYVLNKPNRQQTVI